MAAENQKSAGLDHLHSPRLVSDLGPERALFGGDALAVIDGRIRFMPRPVTLDLDAARRSMQRCLNPRSECPLERAAQRRA
jgi:hypothetical protein